MKKKIKDLTLEECQKICDMRSCCSSRCPLSHYSPDDETIRDCPVAYGNTYLEREIEIED